jgi:hypothetical protein
MLDASSKVALRFLVIARIPLIDPENPDTKREVAELLRQGSPADRSTVNVLRAAANNIDALAAIRSIGQFKQGLRISQAQHQLAHLTSSVVNDCHY